MSKYDILWKYIADNGQNNLKLAYLTNIDIGDR